MGRGGGVVPPFDGLHPNSKKPIAKKYRTNAAISLSAENVTHLFHQFILSIKNIVEKILSSKYHLELSTIY